MVSTQVITPAVWTETARNVAPFSSFELPGAPVEVKRNYVLSPFGTAAMPGYAGFPGTTPAQEVMTGGVALTGVSPLPVSGHPGTALSLTIPAGAPTQGGVTLATGLPAGDYILSMWVNRRTGPTTTMQPAVRGVRGFGAVRTFAFDVWTYVEEAFTISAGEAPANIGWRSQATDPVATTFFVADMQIAPTGQNVPQGALVVSGAKSDYDPDLVSAFTGTPEASASTLTGVGVQGIAVTPEVAAVRSSTWMKEGQYSLRLIAKSATSNTGYVVLSLAAGELNRGTAIVTRRILAPITGSVWASALGRIYWNPVPQVFSPAAPNVAGEVELRVYAPPYLGGGSSIILPHGGLAGTPDVWYDLGAVIPGIDYSGASFSGDTYSSSRKRYRWLDTPGASISVEEIMTAPEVSVPVYEEVTLTSPDDSITFRALPENGGFVYDNVTLQRWYAPAEFEEDVDGRPNANGAYGLGQIFTKEHRPVIVGQYYGANSIEAKAQRQRLIGMANEGNPIMMSVKDESGVTTQRQVWMVDYDAPFSTDFSHFTFDLDFIAPDALRYGGESSDSDTMPTQGSGLVWNLGTAPSGLFFDWGTPGNLGQIELTNVGAAASFPRIEVGGAGALGTGFRITELETGRELTFMRGTATGDVVIFDSRTQRATLNGGDVTGLMSSRKWYTIPKGATRRYQITPLGSVSGSPTITGYVGSAWL